MGGLWGSDGGLNKVREMNQALKLLRRNGQVDKKRLEDKSES